MSELVLAKKPSIKVRIGEAVYEVQSPSNRLLKEFQLAQKDKPEEQSLDSVIDFLDKLGFPKEVAWDLDPSAIEQISEALFPKKKG